MHANAYVKANEYGLISYGPKPDATATGENIVGGYTRAGTPTPVTPDFDNLSKHWATITPTGVARSAYDTNGVSTRACPTSTASGWLIDGNVALPSLGETLTGSYSSVPSATGTAAASPSETQNSVSGSKEIAGMGAGLVGVMMIFTLWL